MSIDLIVNLPFASRHPDLGRLIKENIPQSIRALRARHGFLKIDCLLNAPPRPLTTLHRSSRGASPKCCSIEEKKGVLHRERGAMFARIGTVMDFAPGPREGAKLGRRVASPVTATTDFLAPDILNRRGRAVPAVPLLSEGPGRPMGTSHHHRRGP